MVLGVYPNMFPPLGKPCTFSLSAYLNCGYCFYFSGTFIYYLAGISDAFKSVTLYISLTDTYITRIIFQRIESPTFYYFDFTFELNSAPDGDLYIYTVTRDDFSTNDFVFGVDVATRSGTFSNVHFIYFVWQNFERISSKQYVIILIPSDIESLSTPRC